MKNKTNTWYQKKGIGKLISFLYLFAITALAITFSTLSSILDNPAWINNYVSALPYLSVFYLPLAGGVAYKGIKEINQGQPAEPETPKEDEMP